MFLKWYLRCNGRKRVLGCAGECVSGRGLNHWEKLSPSFFPPFWILRQPPLHRTPSHPTPLSKHPLYASPRNASYTIRRQRQRPCALERLDVSHILLLLIVSPVFVSILCSTFESASHLQPPSSDLSRWIFVHFCLVISSRQIPFQTP